MASFQHVDVATLPTGWKPRHLADVASLRIGRTPARAEPPYWAEGVHPWVSIADMVPFGVVARTKERVSEAAHTEVFRGQLIPAGTMLMSFKLTIGRMSWLGVDAYHNEAIASFHSLSDDIVPEFLFFQLGQLDFTKYQDTAIKGKTLNKSKMEALELVLPPKPEQERIAEVLAEQRALVGALQQHARTMLELRRTLGHRLFVIDADDDQLAWATAPIGQIAKLQSGGTPRRNVQEYWTDGEIPWVKTGEVNNCIITDTEERITQAGLDNSSARIFPEGTLLIAMYGQGVTRGKVALLGVEATTNQACVAVMPTIDLSSEYLYYALQARYADLRELGHGANQKNLSAEIIADFEISYPEQVEEQSRRVEVMQALDERLDLAVAAWRCALKIFNELLAQLMAGHIRYKGERVKTGDGDAAA